MEAAIKHGQSEKGITEQYIMGTNTHDCVQIVYFLVVFDKFEQK